MGQVSLKLKLLFSGFFMIFTTFFTRITTVLATPTYTEYDLSSYTSYVSQDGIDALAQVCNWLVTFVFSLTKLVYLTTDACISALYGMDVINQFSATVSRLANELYDVLYGGLGIMLLVVAFSLMTWSYLKTRNPTVFVKQFLLLSLVIGVSVVWLPNTSIYLNKINTFTMEVQSAVMSVGNDMSGTDGIRQMYFEKAVYEPYLLLNYGTTDEAVVNASDPARSESLLYTEAEDAGEQKKANDDYILANETNNDYVQKGSTAYKLGIALISLVSAVFYAIPIIMCSFLNFAIQMAILFLALFLPISLILSFLPMFWGSVFNVLKTIAILFGFQILAGLGLSIFFAMTNVIDELIVPEQGMYATVGEYMLETLIIILLFALCIWKRDSLVSAITGGAVTNIEVPIVSEMASDVGGFVEAGAGVGLAVATGGATAGALAIMDNADIHAEAMSNLEQQVLEGELDDELGLQKTEPDETSLEGTETEMTGELVLSEEDMTNTVESEMDLIDEADSEYVGNVGESEVDLTETDEIAEVDLLDPTEAELIEIDKVDLLDPAEVVLDDSEMNVETAYNDEVISKVNTEAIDLNEVVEDPIVDELEEIEVQSEREVIPEVEDIVNEEQNDVTEIQSNETENQANVGDFEREETLLDEVVVGAGVITGTEVVGNLDENSGDKSICEIRTEALYSSDNFNTLYKTEVEKIRQERREKKSEANREAKREWLERKNTEAKSKFDPRPWKHQKKRGYGKW